METAETAPVTDSLRRRVLGAITYLRPAFTVGLLADKLGLAEATVRSALEALRREELLRFSDFGPTWPTDPGYRLTIAGHAYKLAHGL